MEVKDKGLKRNAISFLSNVVIGVSSTAPAYSLASALGVIAGIAAYATPAIMAAAFVPMLFIATAFFYLNRAEPDCGATFAWVTRAMGPRAGWIGGWAVLMTNIIVMPSLAVIAGQYSFQLFGYGQPSTLWVTLAGVGWIAIMTAICYFGIELSARTQRVLLGIELAALLLFAGMALAAVYLGTAPAAARHPELSWFNPFAAGSFDTFTEALLVAVFIYWGWDSGVSVNEETVDPQTVPGRAAIASTLLLVAIYMLVAVAAIAYAGPGLLSQNKDDIFAATGKSVLGPWLGKLLIVAVLTSASAATQTTILPAARTALSMAAAGAIPKRFAEINPRFQSPGFATLTMGAISIVWYAGLTSLSKNVLNELDPRTRAMHRLLLCIDGLRLCHFVSPRLAEQRRELRSHGRNTCLRRLDHAFSVCEVLLYFEQERFYRDLGGKCAARHRYRKPRCRFSADDFGLGKLAGFLPARA